MGKMAEARPLVDKVIVGAPSNFSAVLLETIIADTEKRARTTLLHLEHWRVLAQNENSGFSLVPSEFYLAKKVLYGQLKMRSEFESAASKASEVNLFNRGGAFSLVELAAKAGRRDFAFELLRKIYDEDLSGEHREQVVKLAHTLGDRGLVEKALETLYSTKVELLILRAEHQFATRNALADVSIRKALAATKDDSEKARLWAMLVETLIRQGSASEARIEAETMLKNYPSEQGVLLLAQVELMSGEPKGALEMLSPVLAGNKVPLMALEIAALAHLELGQANEARPLLQSLLKVQPGHLRGAQLAVAVETQADKPKEALRIVAALVTKEPQNVGLRFLLAEAERSAAGNTAAVDSLRKSVDEVKGDPRLRLALVQALERNDADAEALVELEKAHTELPEEPMLAAALAERLARAGEVKRAAVLYEALIERAEGDPVLLNNLAMLYSEDLKNATRGVELAEKAYLLSQAAGIADTLGWALFKRGTPADLKRARELLSSVSSQLTSPTSKYHWGAVLIATGDPNQGKNLLRQALAQAGDFAEAEQARRLLASSP